MNPAAILALIADLYSQVTALTQQVTALTQERDRLAAALAEAQQAREGPPAEA